MTNGNSIASEDLSRRRDDCLVKRPTYQEMPQNAHLMSSSLRRHEETQNILSQLCIGHEIVRQRINAQGRVSAMIALY